MSHITAALLLALVVFAGSARADDTDLSAFAPPHKQTIFIEQPQATLGRPGINPDHIGPLWAEHLKREKALRVAENKQLDERRLREKAAREAAAAKAAEDLLFHNFTKADGSPYGEEKIKSYGQGTLTLVDRDGDEHRISRAELNIADQSFIDLWIRSDKPEIRHAPPKPPTVKRSVRKR